MKRFISIVLGIIMVFALGLSLSGCGEDEPVSNSEGPSQQAPPEDDRYKELFKALLEDLNATAGFEIKYVEALDLGGSDIPELVVLSDDLLMIFVVNNDHVDLAYEETIGTEFGVTDVSPHVGFNYIGIETNIVNFHSDDPWNEEQYDVIRAETDDNGATVITYDTYRADSLGADIPNIDELLEFYLNDSSISKDEYMSARDKYLNDAVYIDPLTIDPELIEKFMSSLIQGRTFFIII